MVLDQVCCDSINVRRKPRAKRVVVFCHDFSHLSELVDSLSGDPIVQCDLTVIPQKILVDNIVHF